MMGAVYLRLQTIVECFLHTWCIFNFVGHTGGAFEKWMSISGERTTSGDAYITCNAIITADVEVVSTAISVLPFEEKNIFFRVISPNAIKSNGEKYHGRVSLTVNEVAGNIKGSLNLTVTMQMAYLQCDDDGEYGCTFKVTTKELVDSVHKVTSHLDVRVKPETPVLTIEPESVHPAKESIFLNEKTKVTATCKANVGTQKAGRLEWRIYVNDNPQYVSSKDPRLQPLEKDTLEASDPYCMFRVRQKLVLATDTTQQDIVIVCLVQNVHFQNKSNRLCSDPARDMCAKSLPIWSISGGDNTNVLIALAIAFLALIAGIGVVVLAEKLLARFCEKPPLPPRKRTISRQPSSPPPIQPVVNAPSSEFEEEEERIEEDFSEDSEIDNESEV